MANGERFYEGAPIRAVRPLWDGVMHGSSACVLAVRASCDGVKASFEKRPAAWYSNEEVEIDVARMAYPIPAAKDPWLESEPGLPFGSTFCEAHDPSDRYVCSRAVGHAGHHVSRHVGGGRVGTVNARWPQSAPAVEKRLPRKGDKVVLTKELFGVVAGTSGEIYYAASVGYFCVDFGHQRAQHFQDSEFGTTVVVAEEWEQQPKEPVGVSKAEISIACDADPDMVARRVAEKIAATRPKPAKVDVTVAPAAPSPWIRFDCADAYFEWLVTQSRHLARALFELDMDEHCCRVADEGKGGIGKAKAFDIMWSNVSDETRSMYEWRAAITLKRATELP